MAMTFTRTASQFQTFQVYTGTLDLAEVAANTAAMAEVDITVTGVKSTDMAISFTCTDTTVALGVGNVRVKADDTISVIFTNTDDAATDPADTLTYQLIVLPS